MTSQPINVLTLSATFPSVADPSRGVFVKERTKALSCLTGVNVRVVSPTPWFPPIKRFSKWYRWSQYPRRETFDGLLLDNPRYVLPPKIGGYFHPELMGMAVTKAVDAIRSEFPFDVIDAHWVYPSGAFAATLGRRYGVPVVMTGRGEDMERFPDLPLVGPKIRRALSAAQDCIAVSQQIAHAMINNGGDAGRTHVIPNGVDTDKFHRRDQTECRTRLGLPTDRRIILSVGDRLELKGYHLIVDALPSILKQIPNAYYVIVGGPGRFGRDYSEEIQYRIERDSLSEHVCLAGSRPHDELVDWYNAADLYALMSSREGSPNVLLESLSCGTPAIGTSVGGIQDELADNTCGTLLTARTADAASTAIAGALRADWDRDAIRTKMLKRTWAATAERVHQVLAGAVGEYSA